LRKLLNTLYITSPDSFLARDGENVVVKVGNEERFRLPIHNVEGIITFGYTGASPAFIGLCAERNVGVSFLTEHGRFLGRVSGPVKGNVLLRRQQYRWADDNEKSLEIARLFVAGKITNCRTVLQRALRDYGNNQEMESLVKSSELLNERRKQAMKAPDMSSLRGIEGDSANTYFGLFNELIISQKDDFNMHGRNRRPPMDPVNALLSFVYVLLAHEVQSALETVGLDPYVGFLHKDRPGRASLALDMMEEFRPYLADRLTLSLINRKQVNAKGFKPGDGQGIIMNENTRKEVLTAWQKRKQEDIKHPFLEETVPIGLLPYVQALLLARYIRGDVDNYPVFLMK
jgi:CRISPR-associated protein Cas1